MTTTRKNSRLFGESEAANRGCPFKRGEGRVSKDRTVWLNRYESEVGSKVIFRGWDNERQRWVVEE